MTRRYLAWLALLALAALCINARIHPLARSSSQTHLPSGGFIFPLAPAALRRGAALPPLPRLRPGQRHSTAPALGPVALVAAYSDSDLLTQAPSISAAVLAATLRRLDLPLAAVSGYIYRTGVSFGIDPVYLLAFVVYVDRRVPLPGWAHNVGRIRATGGQPAVEGFRSFGTWEQGITAWYQLMRDLYVRRWRLRSLDAILPVYAPSSRVGVEAELGQMESMIAAWRRLSA